MIEIEGLHERSEAKRPSNDGRTLGRDELLVECIYDNIGAYKGYPHLGSLILRNLVWMAYDDSNIFIVGVIAFSSYL